MNTRIPMTSQGVEKLQKELTHLKNVRRPEIIRSIVAAREYGDLKENSEYLAAKEQQEFCERRILEIERKLLNAQIIDIKNFSPSKKVVFGTTVVIINVQTKKKQTYRIVGEDEADFKKNLISVKSPIARGLIGKEQGDIATVITPNGKIEYKILQVKYL